MCLHQIVHGHFSFIFNLFLYSEAVWEVYLTTKIFVQGSCFRVHDQKDSCSYCQNVFQGFYFKKMIFNSKKIEKIKLNGFFAYNFNLFSVPITTVANKNFYLQWIGWKATD